MCASDVKNSSRMFAITKDKDEETKYITNMRLIVTDENTKELEVDKADDDTAPIHSFFITSDEFGED